MHYFEQLSEHTVFPVPGKGSLGTGMSKSRGQDTNGVKIPIPYTKIGVCFKHQREDVSAGRRSSLNSQPVGSEILQESREASTTRVKIAAKEDILKQEFPSIYGTVADRAQSLVITVHVEGNPVLAVVDTAAAQVTVVNASKAKEWVTAKESTPAFRRGIGDRPVPARKVGNVCFTIGDNPYTGALYFADIEENMLLEYFLAKNKAVIDLSRQGVRLRDQVIILIKRKAVLTPCIIILIERKVVLTPCIIILIKRKTVLTSCIIILSARKTVLTSPRYDNSDREKDCLDTMCNKSDREKGYLDVMYNYSDQEKSCLDIMYNNSDREKGCHDSMYYKSNLMNTNPFDTTGTSQILNR